MIKDTQFYDKESAQYSSKRYPAVARDYVQAFFKLRLALTIESMAPYLSQRKDLTLLEIGCADGVVMREFDHSFKVTFAKSVGIDISEEMVNKARSLNASSVSSFFVRGMESSTEAFDVIVEIGVANYADFGQELAYAEVHLKSHGIYALSIAGKGSLNDKLGGAVGYKNFFSYKEYEAEIRKTFVIDLIVPVGLRVPLLWRVPFIGRLIQPIVEEIATILAPNLFHEKIYFLKKMDMLG